MMDFSCAQLFHALVGKWRSLGLFVARGVMYNSGIIELIQSLGVGFIFDSELELLVTVLVTVFG